MATSFEHVHGPGGLSLLRLVNGDALAELCPERGALVTRLCAGDDELLYLDEETLADRARNVRGGIPVLFPMAGKLPGDAYADGGRTYALTQHGFARNRAFEVTARELDASSVRATCRLAADPATLAAYPWPFELTLTFTLQAARLLIDATLANHGDRPMPHALGYHPYFRVDAAHKGDVRVETDATLAFDNRAGAVVPWAAPDFTQGELDLHLVNHTLPGTVLSRRPLRPVRLEWDEAFTTLVLWTLPGRPFVCAEPWTAPTGALAKSEARLVGPGTSETLRFAIGW